MFSDITINSTEEFNLNQKLIENNYVILKYNNYTDLTSNNELKIENTIYKVTVITGDQPEANTNATILISFINDKYAIKPIVLQKNGTLKHFSRGSVERFFVKAPKFDDIEYIMIKMCALCRNESWYLKDITIEDTESKKSWICKANQWFSEIKEDGLTCRFFKLTNGEEQNTYYDILIKIESPSYESLSNNLFLRIFGSIRNTPKLKFSNVKVIKKGHVLRFSVNSSNVGIINYVRIGINDLCTFKENHGILVRRIFIKSRDADSNFYIAMNNKWLTPKEKAPNYIDLICTPKDLDFTLVNKDLKLQKIKESTQYDIMIWKIDSQFLNERSEVYVQLYGQMGKWTEIFQINDLRKISGTLPQKFRVNGETVGSLRKVKIWHNADGVASAWHLEKIRIIRYLNEKEIIMTLGVMKRQGKLPTYIDTIDNKVIIKPNFSRCLKSDVKLKESGDINLQTIYNPEYLEIPYAEESYFECHTWLTLSEPNKTIDKTFNLNSKRIINSIVKMEMLAN